MSQQMIGSRDDPRRRATLAGPSGFGGIIRSSDGINGRDGGEYRYQSPRFILDTHRELLPIPEIIAI